MSAGKPYEAPLIHSVYLNYSGKAILARVWDHRRWLLASGLWQKICEPLVLRKAICDSWLAICC